MLSLMKMCPLEKVLKTFINFSKAMKIELNTEELQHLQEEQQKTLADGLSSDEDEVSDSVP